MIAFVFVDFSKFLPILISWGVFPVLSFNKFDGFWVQIKVPGPLRADFCVRRQMRVLLVNSAGCYQIVTAWTHIISYPGDRWC